MAAIEWFANTPARRAGTDHGGRGGGAQVGLGRFGWVEQDHLVLVIKGVDSKAPVVLAAAAGPCRKIMVCMPGPLAPGTGTFWRWGVAKLTSQKIAWTTMQKI